MLDTATLRVLGRDDLEAADDLLRRDAVSNVFMASRVQASRDHAWRLGGELWGYVSGGELTALCYAGANFVPAGDDPTALQVFADRARRQGRRCSSMVGPSSQIQQLWKLLESVLAASHGGAYVAELQGKLRNISPAVRRGQNGLPSQCSGHLRDAGETRQGHLLRRARGRLGGVLIDRSAPA